jgi:hypothetical protein
VGGVAEELVVGVDDAAPRVGEEARDGALEVRGVERVVGVEAEDRLGRGPADADVARRGAAEVLREVDDLDALAADGVAERGRLAVGGGVVDDDRAPVGVGLALEARDALGDEAAVVEAGDHHGDAGRAHGEPPAPAPPPPSEAPAGVHA